MVFLLLAKLWAGLVACGFTGPLGANRKQLHPSQPQGLPLASQELCSGTAGGPRLASPQPRGPDATREPAPLQRLSLQRWSGDRPLQSWSPEPSPASGPADLTSQALSTSIHVVKKFIEESHMQGGPGHK